MGNFFQDFKEYDQNYPLGLSNSDSWSKIVKEGGWFFPSYCELVNGSLYIIGRLELGDNTNRYLYVSKFNTLGIKEWELSIKIDDKSYYSHVSYVFDNDNNLFILYNYIYLNLTNYIYSFNTLLIKLNSSGALLFSKEFSPGRYYFNAFLVLADNNSLLIVGSATRLFIEKFNNAGQFLWNTSFYIDYTYSPPYIVKDSGCNMYLYFSNNSICHLAKINGSGSIVWQIGLPQMGLENEVHKLIIDSNDNLFIMGSKNYTTKCLLKLNSTGNQIKEILIESFYIRGNIWHLNDLLVYNINKYSMSILCYDLNLDLKWNFSLSDYITGHFYLQTFLAKDSHDNVYIIQNNKLGNINLIKISSTGEFLSRIIWGGFFDEKPESLLIDLDNNIYFSCECECYNVWRERYRYTILVKNPVNGGTPPEPRRDLDLRDYFLFSVVGIACIISPIALLSILRSNKKNKKRIG
jgi:hypothetical protein